VLQPAHFTVQTVDAGIGEVLVYIEDPEGHTEEVWRGHWGSDKSADQQRNGLAMAAGGTLQRWRRGGLTMGVAEGVGSEGALTPIVSLPVGQGGSQQ